MRTRPNRPTASAAGTVLPAVTPWTKAIAFVDEAARVRREAEELRQLADEDRQGQAVQVPDLGRLRQKVGDESEPRDRAEDHERPDHEREDRGERDRPLGSPPAPTSGRIVAAIIGPSEESGPRTRIRDGPKTA